MMSRKFIESQYEYYRKHLGSGNFTDRGMICGQFHYFEGLLRICNKYPDQEEIDEQEFYRQGK